MSKIIIEAMSEKGKELMGKKGRSDPMSKMALKMCGVREECISRDPLIIWVTVKKCPAVVLKQMEYALNKKFEDLGGVRDRDYKINPEV